MGCPRPSAHQPAGSQSGSAALMVLVAGVVVALLGAAGLGRSVEATRGVARAQATADLTAGAAVVGGEVGARRIATANGAVLRSAVWLGDVVTVEVVRDGVVGRATARPAEGSEGTLGGGP